MDDGKSLRVDLRFWYAFISLNGHAAQLRLAIIEDSGSDQNNGMDSIIPDS